MAADTAIYLAKNVTLLRTSKGYTQAQLAKRSGLPRSTVTHIESGAANPSLTHLLALANGLQVSLEELLSRPRKAVEHIKASDIPVQERQQGRARIFKLLPDKIRGMNIDRMEIDRGIHMPGHVHLKGTKEYLTVLEGEITVHTEGGETVLLPGDVLAFEGDQPHAYRNSGDRRAKAISVIIPIS
jgi:XRE family transcriptional regulator, regulator of sulfur utilization